MVEVKENEVEIQVMFRGDAQEESSAHPKAPGHEIVGTITQVGSAVKSLNVGEHVGVGTFSGSCKNCCHCNENNHQSCARRVVTSQGSTIVVQEDFATKIPEGLDMQNVAPLFSGGIILYNAMMENNMMRGGIQIAVIGTGPMAQLAVKFAKALNASNQIFCIDYKEGDMPADASGMFLWSDDTSVKKFARAFDYVIDTTTTEPQWNSVHEILKPRGSFIVAMPGSGRLNPIPFSLVVNCHIVQTTGYGSIQRMGEMLEFCVQHRISA